MSRSSDKSPSTNFQNSLDGAQFRSPFFSPRNGPDRSGLSPAKNNFGWRSNPRHNRRFYGQNDHQRFNFSPRGSRRGGYFRGGHRGPHRSEDTDISLYVNPSMLSDPWKELTDLLETKVQSHTSVSSVGSTLENSGVTSEPNDTQGELTEESILISDSSIDLSNQTVEAPESIAPDVSAI